MVAKMVSGSRPPNATGLCLATFTETLPLNRILPLTAPLVVGVKLTLTGTLCPARRSMGNCSPVSANPFCEIATRMMLIAAFPGFDNVAAWVWVLPMATFPKLKLDGFSLIREELMATPDMVKMGVERIMLLASTTRPWELPTLCGEYTICRTALWPGARVKGSFLPVIWKSAWLTWARVTTIGDLVLLTMVLLRTLVVPTGTEPKSRTGEVATSPVEV